MKLARLLSFLSLGVLPWSAPSVADGDLLGFKMRTLAGSAASAQRITTNL